MDEKIQDNSIFEAELSDRYREELLTDIPDIWDKINARLDSVSAVSSTNDPVADSTTNTNSNISSDYLPNENAAPVIRYNKAAAKSSRGRNISSALAYFIPIAAAVMLLCICVPVFIKLQYSNSSESATATADFTPAYENGSDSVTLDGGSVTDGYSEENKQAENSFYSADTTRENAYAGESEECYDNAETESAVESIATDDDTANSAYIKVYVSPDADISKLTEIASDYDMDIKPDSSTPDVYNLFPNHAIDEKELSKLCDEIKKNDFIVQATLAK